MAARNQRKHRDSTFAMKALLFARKSKEETFCLTRQLCCGHYLGVMQGENSEIQNAVFSK